MHRYRRPELRQCCPEMPFARKHHGQTTSEMMSIGIAAHGPALAAAPSQLNRTVRCQ